jgi:hypothetical protein
MAERYDVLDKWHSVSFDDATRRVLARRLAPPPEPRFFDAAAFRALQAACARLLATEVGKPPIANWIDDDLAAGRGEGFRHSAMPRLEDAWRHGMAGLRAHALARHGQEFAELDAARQDATLREVQQGDVERAHFGAVDPQHFFAHLLLKAAAAHFYSEPEAWSEIGFGGPASPRGYVRLLLDRWDPWEAPPGTGHGVQPQKR